MRLIPQGRAVEQNVGGPVPQVVEETVVQIILQECISESIIDRIVDVPVETQREVPTFQTVPQTVENPQVKPIYIGVNKMDSGTAGSKQEKCDEISNKMKSMSTKISWKRFHQREHPQPIRNFGAMVGTEMTENEDD